MRESSPNNVVEVQCLHGDRHLTRMDDVQRASIRSV